MSNNIEVEYKLELTEIDGEKAGVVNLDGFRMRINKIEAHPSKDGNPPYLECDYSFIDPDRPDNQEDFDERFSLVVANVVDEYLNWTDEEDSGADE